MKDVVQQLRFEHADMSRLLDILARQAQIIEQAGQPDYPVIEDIISYFLDYPDQCHHPKEDIVAAKLLEMAPERARRLRGLAEMHRELAALTGKVAEIVGQTLNEEMVPRSELARVLNEFIDSQRHHILMEEEFFLPLAEELLHARDLIDLEYELFARDDPLHAAKAESRFTRLRNAIVNSD